MDKEIKREARKQFFHYFRIWFLIVGILAVICLIVGALHAMVSNVQRGNWPPTQSRVFDYADVLSDSEEKELEEYIARCEDRYHFDIVAVTICEDVESYGYWDRVMESYADDFYDEGGFGYNKLHGDGILILDNWYEGQEGTWLSTTGRVYEKFSYRDIDRVLDAIDNRVETNPYAAYKAGIDAACKVMASGETAVMIPWIAVLFVPILVAAIYAAALLHQTPAKDTTTATTYVAGGKPVMREQRDDFIRKSVVTTRIQSSSGGGGGGGGRAGGHVSRGGVSHGGGGRRR